MRTSAYRREPVSTGELRRQVAATLGLAAILCNLFAGIIFSLGYFHSNLDQLASANGWSVICSNDGLSVVDANGKKVDVPEQPGHEQIHCLFCLPLMQGDAIVAEAPVLATRQIAEAAAGYSHAVIALAEGEARHPFWPRGPPSA